MADLLKKTITVEFGGEEFVFKIPSIQEDIGAAIAAREIRRRLVGPEGDAGEEGLNWEAVYMCRACAAFEKLLLQGPKWVWTVDITPSTPTPRCDTALLPEDRNTTILGVYDKYMRDLDSFRKERAAAGQPAGQKAVAS